MSSENAGAPSARNLVHLLSFSRRLATEPDLRCVLRDLLDHACSMTGAERGFFLFRRRGTVSCEAAVGVTEAESASPPEGTAPAASPRPRPQLSEGVLARVFDSGEALLATDLPADGRFRARLSVRRLGLRSVLAVPFPSRAGGTGVLYLDSRVSRTIFRRDDLDLLTAFASQAALAFENATLASAMNEPGEERRGPLEDDARPGASPPSADAGHSGRSRSVSPPQPAGEAGNPVPARRAAAPAIVGSSPALRRLMDVVERVGPSELPILIVGESGTGKELVARAIHARSARRGRSFLAENCAAIPESLIESELFGAVRGAYTGADRDREGLFRAADGGTLFLDEIGEMPLPLQARLLRALQEGEVRPVGSHRSYRVNVRILAATNKDPGAAIASHRLRIDLYYRLAGMTIEIPPLRERREDIPTLATYFLSRTARGPDTTACCLSPSALSVLASYAWPGNIRELENEVERAAVLARGPTIEAEDLSPRLRGDVVVPPGPGRSAERTMIEAALLAAAGSVTGAAEAIGWSRQKLYRRMSRLGVQRTYGRQLS